MKQQVNLYRPEFDPTLPFPDFRHGLWVLGGVAGLLLLILAWQVFRLSQGADDIQDVMAKADRAAAELDALKAKLPDDRMQPVDQQIAELNEELLRLREIRGLMAGQGIGEALPGNRRGFSDQFQGFSRQYLKGISLAQIKLFDGGARVELQGFAAPPEQAPRYLAALHADRAFKEVVFGPLTMQREPSGTEMAFQIKHPSEEAE